MTKKKICKKCKLFYDTPECPICKTSAPATSYQGRINILDANKSTIAKKIGLAVNGEYAIKIR
jgi:RNA polymerase subunit RPABC4/transcription elongation factor Spt4